MKRLPILIIFAMCLVIAAPALALSAPIPTPQQMMTPPVTTPPPTLPMVSPTVFPSTSTPTPPPPTPTRPSMPTIIVGGPDYFRLGPRPDPCGGGSCEGHGTFHLLNPITLEGYYDTITYRCIDAATGRSTCVMGRTYVPPGILLPSPDGTVVPYWGIPYDMMWYGPTPTPLAPLYSGGIPWWMRIQTPTPLPPMPTIPSP